MDSAFQVNGDYRMYECDMTACHAIYAHETKIDNMSLTKMKYVLYNDGAQVLKNQMGAHAQEEHDEKEEQNISNENGFEAMFETTPFVSSLEMASTSTWLTRTENRLAWFRDECTSYQRDAIIYCG